MTLAELERRLTQLEKVVEELRAKVAPTPAEQRPWWQEQAGAFANDPVFDEIVRLGLEYRESLRPGRKKAKPGKNKKKSRA